jgi:hypothetical protein
MSLARVVSVLLGLGSLLLGGGETAAEEYRLRVANLYRPSFAHYFEGPIGRGEGELAMPKLQRALDAGEISGGALLTDRAFRYGWDDLVQAFGAVKARATITPGGGGARPWDEAVWEGTPGERTVFVIASSTTNYQTVYHTALGGGATGEPLHYYVPYQVTGNPTPVPVVAYGLSFMRFYTTRGNLWSRYLSRSVSLAQGVALIVGTNEDPLFADWVYIVVEHPPQPATFNVVVGWDRRHLGDSPNVETWFP